MQTRLFAFRIGTLAIMIAGCEGDDPEATSPDLAGGGAERVVASLVDENLVSHDPTGCEPLANDYLPRAAGMGEDAWPACISDDNDYHIVNPSIGALGRVAAFEDISVLLGFGGGKVPSPQDFLDARLRYTEEQGIESRVVRREDEHYPPAPAACRDLSPEQQAQYPDRCVGPVKIRPILNAAFEAGIQGEDAVANASRIEGALLWFFYISSFKEATTCAAAAQDCDSMWAKYTGGEDREGGLGLARYVKPRSQMAHDRIWDGLLAVRCWRDLDNPMGEAMNLELRDQARAQLDRALLFGVAQIVSQRVGELPSEPAWQSTKILAQVLGREATLRDPTQAENLRAELATDDASAVDPAVVIQAIDALFPCP
jgi:hypothetical protein